MFRKFSLLGVGAFLLFFVSWTDCLASLPATPSLTRDINQTSARFGSGVSSAGDVNGDGYDDVMVGGFFYDNGESNEGGVFLYYGSSTGVSADPVWSFESNRASEMMGNSVSSAGDVNDDGYDDILIGSSSYSNGEASEGVAYLFYGSASGLAASADWSAESNKASAYFGGSVASAGDVNNDGYDDFVVGAWGYSNGQSMEGAVFGYYGSASGPSASADWVVESNLANAFLGTDVSFAGDVDGDGFDDVIAGAYGYANGQSYEGAAFAYYGSASGLSASADWSVESNRANTSFGSGVSFAGDINGDGYDDVVVGANAYDNGQTDEGGAFVYYGSSSGLVTSVAWSMETNQASAYIGGVSSGDMNNDGYGDVIVGSHFYDNGQADEGVAFVYYGSASGLAASADWMAETNQASAYLAGGNGVSVGDINNDHYDDVLLGTNAYDNGQADEGALFVYFYDAPTHSLAYSAGANGSLTGVAAQVVVRTNDGSPVTAVPDPGYQFVNWSDASINNPRTDTNVLSDIAVVANFILEPSIDAPSKLQAKMNKSLGVVLDWRDNSENEDGFKIQRKKVGGAFEEIHRNGANDNDFVDKDVAIEKKYVYRVKAYNDTMDSDYSNEDWVIIKQEVASSDAQLHFQNDEQHGVSQEDTDENFGAVMVSDKSDEHGSSPEEKINKADKSHPNQSGASFIKTPVGEVTTSSVAVAGIVTATLFSLASSASTSSGFSLLRNFNLGVLGLRRKKNWGVVFESRTKVPVDFAQVVIYTSGGKIAESAMTDKEGRFGFLAVPGDYTIKVFKENFVFPSQLAPEKNTDDVYGRVYKGGEFSIDKEQITEFNIPIDAQFDLLQLAQTRIKRISSVGGLIFHYFTNIFFIFGFVLTAFAQILHPTNVNLALLVLYVFLLGHHLIIRKKTFGRLIDASKKKPIPFARINIFREGDLSVKKGFVITDMYGRYYKLMESGRYVLDINGTTLDRRFISEKRAVTINGDVFNNNLSL